LFDAVQYKERNVVERCINKLKHYRAVATATTSASTCTRAPSMSPRSESGSATLSSDPQDRP
jgi:hypothetical protein